MDEKRQAQIRRIQNRLHAAVDSIVDEEGIAAIRLFAVLPTEDPQVFTPFEIGQIRDPSYEVALGVFILEAVTGEDQPILVEETPILPRSH